MASTSAGPAGQP